MLFFFAGCSEPPPKWHPGLALSHGPWQSGPVAAPPKGALLGAWVKPESYSQPGRLAAIAGFEASIGRELDIVHSYRRLHEEIGTESDLAFAARATLMISWAGATTDEILSGAVDERIRLHAKQIKALTKPVLLRVRWEMDRPNLAASVGTPSDYQQSWRYVRRLFAEEGATNVSWVFCPTAEGFEQGRAADYYPGDDTVDWTCVDVYAGSRLRPIAELLTPFLTWAAQRPKPISQAWNGATGSARRPGPSGPTRRSKRCFTSSPTRRTAPRPESSPSAVTRPPSTPSARPPWTPTSTRARAPPPTEPASTLPDDFLSNGVGDVARLVVRARRHEVGEVNFARRGAHAQLLLGNPLRHSVVRRKDLRVLDLSLAQAHIGLAVRGLAPRRGVDLTPRRVDRRAHLDRPVTVLVDLAVEDDELRRHHAAQPAGLRST
jgi:hypothetical protein